MVSRTIKISEENYKRLLNIATELQKQRQEKVSFDDTIGVMELKKTDKKKKSIMDFAGAWSDMSDEEADDLMKEINRERRLASRRL